MIQIKTRSILFVHVRKGITSGITPTPTARGIDSASDFLIVILFTSYSIYMNPVPEPCRETRDHSAVFFSYLVHI